MTWLSQAQVLSFKGMMITMSCLYPDRLGSQVAKPAFRGAPNTSEIQKKRQGIM